MENHVKKSFGKIVENCGFYFGMCINRKDIDDKFFQGL